MTRQNQLSTPERGPASQVPSNNVPVFHFSIYPVGSNYVILDVFTGESKVLLSTGENIPVNLSNGHGWSTTLLKTSFLSQENPAGSPDGVFFVFQTWILCSERACFVFPYFTRRT
jgi:hypothetical protein